MLSRPLISQLTVRLRSLARNLVQNPIIKVRTSLLGSFLPEATATAVFSMKIGLFHGYNLGGSGSNEYTRYLAMALLAEGAEVHLICREPEAKSLGFVDIAIRYDQDGHAEMLFDTSTLSDNSTATDKPLCYLHELPDASVLPVYVTDKQRDGVVKSFSNLTDEELAEYHTVSCNALKAILSEHPLDMLHCNHVTYQPQIAEEVCAQTNTPYIIYPHGSAIEYTVKTDDRYFKKVRESLQLTDGLIIGNNEVKQRIINLYPDLENEIKEKSQIVGVGVDTSLFTSCPDSKRQSSLNELISMELGGGKTQALTKELEAKLDAGDIKAVTKYRNSYVQKLADEEISSKLENIDLSSPVMLFVGAFTAGKGIQGLLCAMCSALRQQPNLQLVIVGAGAYRETLEALVHLLTTRNLPMLKSLASQGFDLDFSDNTGSWQDVEFYLENHSDELLECADRLKSNVHFVGRLNHDQLKFLFPIVDLAVFPSVVPEAYPLVLMESLSNGVLPMVSYFSGFTDGIDELADVIPEDLLSLMRVPMSNEERIVVMAENLNSILSSESFKAIRPKLREVACERYDWSLRAKQMIEAYTNALNMRQTKLRQKSA